MPHTIELDDIMHDERDDIYLHDGNDDVFHRHVYGPGEEHMITVAEVERLRKVELELLRLRPVAVELAIAYKHKAGILWDEWQLIDRARAVGLLPEKGK